MEEGGIHPSIHSFIHSSIHPKVEGPYKPYKRPYKPKPSLATVPYLQFFHHSLKQICKEHGEKNSIEIPT